MRPVALVAVVVLVVAGACTNEDRPPIGIAPTGQPTPSEEPTPPAIEVEIYADVIERLVTKDHTLGRKTSPFDHVYVIEGPVEGAGNPMTGFEPSRDPFDDATKEAILDRLERLPPIEFIADADDVRIGEQGMGGVKGNGVIITLGPIRRQSPTKFHVGHGIWCGGLCGQWMTYVVEQRGDDWKITGTTGRMAIS